AIAQQHDHLRPGASSTLQFCARVGHDQVRNSVAVHVPDRDLPALYAVYNVVDRRLEGAIAVAQQHAHCLEPDSAGYDEIDNPVARQVPDRDPIGVRAARVIGYDGLEGAIAVAEHHSCTAVAAAFALPLVAHDNIGNPVAVHVRDCGRVASKTARVIVNHGLK